MLADERRRLELAVVDVAREVGRQGRLRLGLPDGLVVGRGLRAWRGRRGEPRRRRGAIRTTESGRLPETARAFGRGGGPQFSVVCLNLGFSARTSSQALESSASIEAEISYTGASIKAELPFVDGYSSKHQFVVNSFL
jgi:hypothetical protein